MGGGLLAGKPKPTSCALRPLLFPPPASPQSRRALDASSGARLHHLQGSEPAGKTQLAAPGREPRLFASTGSTGHPVRFSPRMPREIGSHKALGRLVARMGRGPSYPARIGSAGGGGRLRDSLVAHPLSQAPDHVRGKAKRTAEFVNGN